MRPSRSRDRRRHRSAHFSHLQHGLYDVHRGGLVAHVRRAGVRASGDEENNEKAVHLFLRMADFGRKALTTASLVSM